MSQQPNFADLVAAITAIKTPPQPAPAPEEKGLAKHAASVVGAVVIALVLWFGNTVTNQTTTVAQAVTKIDGMATSLDELRKSVGGTKDEVAVVREQTGRLDQRMSALEQTKTVTNERLRILEGQQPLQRAP